MEGSLEVPSGLILDMAEALECLSGALGIVAATMVAPQGEVRWGSVPVASVKWEAEDRARDQGQKGALGASAFLDSSFLLQPPLALASEAS